MARGDGPPVHLAPPQDGPAIAPDLPEKTEMRAECGLTRKQAALYEGVVEDLANRLQTAEGIARRGWCSLRSCR